MNRFACERVIVARRSHSKDARGRRCAAGIYSRGQRSTAAETRPSPAIDSANLRGVKAAGAGAQTTSTSPLVGLFGTIRGRVVVLYAKVVFSFLIALGGFARVKLVLGDPALGPSGLLAIRISRPLLVAVRVIRRSGTNTEIVHGRPPWSELYRNVSRKSTWHKVWCMRRRAETSLYSARRHPLGHVTAVSAPAQLRKICTRFRLVRLLPA